MDNVLLNELVKKLNSRGFPHIAKNIEFLKDEPELYEYLANLTINSKDRHIRKGLPYDILMDILRVFNAKFD